MTHPVPDVQDFDAPESAVPIHMASGWVPGTKGDPFIAAAEASGPVEPSETIPVGAQAHAVAAGDAAEPAKRKS